MLTDSETKDLIRLNKKKEKGLMTSSELERLKILSKKQYEIVEPIKN